MGGVRNGKSELEPGESGARQDTLAVEALSGPQAQVQSRVEQHLQVAFRLLHERQAPKAFGELVRATRTLPMTRRLAAALVAVSLKAGTEAAAITLLSSAVDKVDGLARRDVRRQLARVLRKVDQLPRAIEVLEALLAAVPDDHASRRVLQQLLQRTGRWEALVLNLEREAQDAFQRGEYARAARAASWRARIQAEQLRNLARAAESYGQAANYLEQMEDAVGAFTVRLDGLRVLHASGASEAVLTAAASVCMSAAARLGRDAQARQVLEELKLIPPRVETAASEPAPAQGTAPEPEARNPRNAATVEMSLPLLKAMLAAAASEQNLSGLPGTEPLTSPVPVAQAATPPAPESVVTKSAEPSTPEAPPAGATASPSLVPPTPPIPLEAAARPPTDTVIYGAAKTELLMPVIVLPEESAPQAAQDDEGRVELMAPEDVEEEQLEASDGVPLTELFEIPEEESLHAAPPVRSTESSAPPLPPVEEEEEEEEEEPLDEQRLEAQLIARKAWRELAQFYLARADRAKEPMLRAEALTRLAELMENELSDPSGAARTYREIVTLTGDREALKEQLRLLGQRGDPSLVRRALDEAVQTARTPKARAAAFLTRAERALEVGERAQAQADFETAEALTPGMLLVLAGLVRCVPNNERAIMANRLRAALAAAPRRSPDRLDALRALASVADDSLKDAKLAQWAWSEVLAEDPDDARARTRLLELARVLKDRGALSQLLREQLARESRGPTARLARMELVSALEDTGDADGALTELRQAVRFEPGHKEAWLLLADRLTERGQIGEAVWALDNAASAMDDEAERLRTWQRLASFCHNVLKDPTRAETYSRRADNLRRSLENNGTPPAAEPPRAAAPKREAVPRREGTGSRPQILIPPPANVELTPSGQSLPLMGDDPATVVHEVATAPGVPDHARPTIEFSAVTFPGDKMPFSDEETTATEAPAGFPSPELVTEPVSVAKAPAPEKAPGPAAAAPPKKATSKKVEVQAIDPAKELDALIGEDSEEESDHTSPFLSAWSMKRPPLLKPPPKGDAPPPPRESPEQKPAPQMSSPVQAKSDKPTARMRKERPLLQEESPPPPPPPPPPEPEAPPARAKASTEDTAAGRRAAMKPSAPPREPLSGSGLAGAAKGTGSRPALPGSSSQDPASSKGSRGQKRQEPADSPFAQVSPQEPDGPPEPSSGPVQHTSFISWEAPPGKMEPVRRVARARGAAPAAAPKAPAEPPAAEPAVFKKVREYPLDADLYIQIAEYFEGRGDGARAVLMREIADALDGREGTQARPPRQALSGDDRSGLRHPILRSPQGELLTCVGVALCRLFPVHGRAAGTKEPLRSSSGPGAPVAMEALQATQRLLGLEAPEVVLSEDNGPPFSLVFTNSSRMLVGKQAVRQTLPPAELRFYAGRALICLEPDLLALRSLKKDQILRGLALLSTVLKDGGSNSLEARVVRETLTPNQLERARDLFAPATRQFDVSAMADAGRDSANRAGLIACGAVGPALAALKMKRALEREVIELVRFAASERYFQLRSS